MDNSHSKSQHPSDNNVIYGVRETYALLEVIGRGAYGVVYKGIGRDGGIVAIKRVGRAKLTIEEKKQLQEEISLLRKLNHPHIVKYVEAIDYPESPYLDIIMEYVEGGSLFSMVRDIRKSLNIQNNSKVLGELNAVTFIKQVILGLKYLHLQGVVHSDIKGANILVTKDKCVKLADFGLASTKLGKDLNEASPEATSTSDNPMDFLGSPYWMAPEIVTQTGKSTASDIWSVGCTVIELLTGFPPNHQLNEMSALFRLMNDDCPPLPSGISPDCEDFLRKCFCKDMKTRATADELISHRWLLSGEVGFEEDNNGSFDDGFENITPSQSMSPIDYNSLNHTSSQRLEMYAEEEEEEEDVFNDIEFNDDEVEYDQPAELFFDSSTVNSPSSGTDYDEDPFKNIKIDPEAELERERKRKQKELWDQLKSHVKCIASNMDEKVRIFACDELVNIFTNHPDQRYNLIMDPGLLPILDVLENNGDGNPNIVQAMLKVALSLVEDGCGNTDNHNSIPISPSATILTETTPNVTTTTADIPHDLCIAGFLPAIMQYCESDSSFEIRCLAARFLEYMLIGETTTHMFIACRGFTVFVRMLEDNVLKAEVLNRVALAGIERMLAIDKQRHKRDFCRRFVSAGLLQKIAKNIQTSLKYCKMKTSLDILYPHIIQLSKLLQTFAARADPEVKAEMTASEVLIPLLTMIIHPSIPKEAVQSILCCLRDISRDPQTHDALQEVGTIEKLVTYLEICQDDDDNNNDQQSGGGKPKHFIISTLHNLVIVSPSRQEKAAMAGLVPHLIRYIRSDDIYLRALCVDIYSGLACASHRTRVELQKWNGIDVYVELLEMLSVPGTVRKWQARVLQAISIWLEEDQTEQVENRLVQNDNCISLCKSLAGVGVEDVEGVLEPYWKLVSGSIKVNEACGKNDELVSAMVSWLDKMYASVCVGKQMSTPNSTVGGSRGRLLLLRTLLAHARRWTTTSVSPGLIQAIRVLLQHVVLETDKSIMVREQASLLVQALEGK